MLHAWLGLDSTKQNAITVLHCSGKPCHSGVPKKYTIWHSVIEDQGGRFQEPSNSLPSPEDDTNLFKMASHLTNTFRDEYLRFKNMIETVKICRFFPPIYLPDSRPNRLFLALLPLEDLLLLEAGCNITKPSEILIFPATYLKKWKMKSYVTVMFDFGSYLRNIYFSHKNSV